MASIVARIRLAEGQTGFYDELSGVMLNWNHPVASIHLGTNLTHLRKALKHHKIKLLEGSLGTSRTFKQVLMEAKSRRTGIALETLMGNTPLAQEPTEVIDSDDDIHKDTPAETIEADVPKVAEEVKEEPAMEDVPVAEEEPTREAVADEPEVQQLATTPKSVRSLKVGATKEITLSHTASSAVVTEGAEFVTAELAQDGMSITLTGVAPGNAVVTITPGVKMCDGATLSVKVVEA